MGGMGTIYDEIEIEDMAWDVERCSLTYPCPCGDKFILAAEDLLNGEDIAPCPSCSLRIRIVFDPDTVEAYLSSLVDKFREQGEGGNAKARAAGGSEAAS